MTGIDMLATVLNDVCLEKTGVDLATNGDLASQLEIGLVLAILCNLSQSNCQHLSRISNHRSADFILGENLLVSSDDGQSGHNRASKAAAEKQPSQQNTQKKDTTIICLRRVQGRAEALSE